MSPALVLDTLTAHDLLAVLQGLMIYAAVILVNAAGWVLATHVLTWHGTMFIVLAGVLLTACHLPRLSIMKQPYRPRLGQPLDDLAA